MNSNKESGVKTTKKLSWKKNYIKEDTNAFVDRTFKNDTNTIATNVKEGDADVEPLAFVVKNPHFILDEQAVNLTEDIHYWSTNS